MATHNELGAKGEQLAVEYLQQKGYKILERNWRFKKAEIDIIALKNDILIPVEVKTRTSNYFGNPQDFVNQKKIQLLVEAINEYVISKDLDVEVRFDIVAIIKNKNTTKIEHLEDAFLHF
ncbi:YraN family protein [Lutibacter sp. TH_r2]|uniref:YraN family protein n=1 Tax=Lutibacter sp. TH_r2 TaxID=3082083 RepID=UPI002953F5B3|nr:YraN family protein [Lutibacter sp. TH_r2]MDV7186415.1 YraN family protein [Lutibacter sp. TH_r2]